MRKIHPSHDFIELFDGIHCSRCYCETDWPLAEYKCNKNGMPSKVYEKPKKEREARDEQ